MQFVRKQKLGFIATVCPDGTPNLSPKGTTNVWDSDHLIFADIYSPGTVSNLLVNPSIEINIVDPLIRKGYRFKGTAKVLSDGTLFEEILAFYRKSGSTYTIRNIVLVKIDRILPLLSPVYDTGISEEDVKNKWLKWLSITALALLIFIIGLSRVYLRVHYASDVIAGYCLGCIWLLLSVWVLGKIEKFTSKKVAPIVEEKKRPVANIS